MRISISPWSVLWMVLFLGACGGDEASNNSANSQTNNQTNNATNNQTNNGMPSCDSYCSFMDGCGLAGFDRSECVTECTDLLGTQPMAEQANALACLSALTCSEVDSVLVHECTRGIRCTVALSLIHI